MPTPKKNKPSITRYDALTGTPVLLLCGEAWAEMVASKTIDEFNLPFHGDDQSVATLDKHGNVLAFISYIKYGKELWIKCSYTKPACRRLGLHNALMAELKKIGKEQKMGRITGGTFGTNKTMQAVYRAQGRVKQSENWYIPIA